MPDHPPLNAAQVHLIETHLRLARNLASSFWKRLPHSVTSESEESEVFSIAYQGLVSAALDFNPAWRPDDPKYDPFLAFGAYAKTRINGAIMDWQRKQDHVPRRQRKIYKDLQERGYGEGRSLEELSDLTGMPVDKLRAITLAVEATGLGLDNDANTSSDPSSVEDAVLASVVMGTLADTISTFPPIQRSVVVLRYFHGLDFSAIAVELEVGVLTVRTLHAEAVALMHESMLHTAQP